MRSSIRPKKVDKAQKALLAEGTVYRKGRELTKKRGQFIDLARAKVREGSCGERLGGVKGSTSQ